MGVDASTDRRPTRRTSPQGAVRNRRRHPTPIGSRGWPHGVGNASHRVDHRIGIGTRSVPQRDRHAERATTGSPGGEMHPRIITGPAAGEELQPPARASLANGHSHPDHPAAIADLEHQRRAATINPTPKRAHPKTAESMSGPCRSVPPSRRLDLARRAPSKPAQPPCDFGRYRVEVAGNDPASISPQIFVAVGSISGALMCVSLWRQRS
jgi:hypothetical protein